MNYLREKLATIALILLTFLIVFAVSSIQSRSEQHLEYRSDQNSFEKK